MCIPRSSSSQGAVGPSPSYQGERPRNLAQAFIAIGKSAIAKKRGAAAAGNPGVLGPSPSFPGGTGGRTGG